MGQKPTLALPTRGYHGESYLRVKNNKFMSEAKTLEKGIPE